MHIWQKHTRETEHTPESEPGLHWPVQLPQHVHEQHPVQTAERPHCPLRGSAAPEGAWQLSVLVIWPVLLPSFWLVLLPVPAAAVEHCLLKLPAAVVAACDTGAHF